MAFTRSAAASVPGRGAIGGLAITRPVLICTRAAPLTMRVGIGSSGARYLPSMTVSLYVQEIRNESPSR